jgi:hypothetical protein
MMMMIKKDYKNRHNENLVDNPDKLFPAWYWIASAVAVVYFLFKIFLIGDK